MSERPDQHYADPELISIIEGPPPEFLQPREIWASSIYDAARLMPIAYCRMRTVSGPRMFARCRNAWETQRPVKLDFPDGTGLRRQVDIVGVRWTEEDEGHLLHLWVRLPELPSGETDRDIPMA